MWFKETGNSGWNCGWDNWDDGPFNHMEFSVPLCQKASPELQPSQCSHTAFRVHCAPVKPVRACMPHAAGAWQDNRVLLAADYKMFPPFWLYHYNFQLVQSVLIIVQIYQLLLMEHTGFLQERSWLKEFKHKTHFKFYSNCSWTTRAFFRDPAELQLHILIMDKYLKLFWVWVFFII